MMESQSKAIPSVCRPTGVTGINTLLLFAMLAAIGLSGCNAQSGTSMLKVESGEKTLVDVKKNENDNVQIELGVPKSNSGY